ncbi:MAG: hypothetical protein PVG65_02185, partial [Candidatus Thorarchaeota archaeon]
MKRVKLLIGLFSSIILLIMISSVSAEGPTLYYFQTDKLVYEVGETIEMVSKIKADFSEDGWCSVSFKIFTDIGLVFIDEYYIPPSPDVRYLTSSYIIYPNETTPGLDGVQARANFQITICDEGWHVEESNVDFNITRGSLEVVPETSLITEYGTYTTLLLKIISMYNENIIFPSQIISLEISDLNGTSIIQNDTISNLQGIVNLLWNTSTYLPGAYNLTVLGNGTDCFLPFSQSFQLFVEPAASIINFVSDPETIFCKSSDEVDIESVDLVVEHLGLGNEQKPILSSFVRWKTNFSQGTLTEL